MKWERGRKEGRNLEGAMVRSVVVDEMNQAGTLFLQFNWDRNEE